MPARRHCYNTRNYDPLKNFTPKHEFYRISTRYQMLDLVKKSVSSLLDKIKTHSIKGFTLYFKHLTFNSYSLHCNIVNCYSCNKSQ